MKNQAILVAVIVPVIKVPPALFCPTKLNGPAEHKVYISCVSKPLFVNIEDDDFLVVYPVVLSPIHV